MRATSTHLLVASSGRRDGGPVFANESAGTPARTWMVISMETPPDPAAPAPMDHWSSTLMGKVRRRTWWPYAGCTYGVAQWLQSVGGVRDTGEINVTGRPYPV